jgi:hypothetical protein
MDFLPPLALVSAGGRHNDDIKIKSVGVLRDLAIAQLFLVDPFQNGLADGGALFGYVVRW